MKAKICEDEKPKQHVVYKKDDTEVKDLILKYIQQYSYCKMNLKELRMFLLQHLEAARVPSMPIISKIIKEDFHLKNATYKGSMYKYQDPSYNEKRLWISRLLA